MPPWALSSCTACPRIAATRWKPRSSIRRPRWCSTRRKTACIFKRQSFYNCWERASAAFPQGVCNGKEKGCAGIFRGSGYLDHYPLAEGKLRLRGDRLCGRRGPGRGHGGGRGQGDQDRRLQGRGEGPARRVSDRIRVEVPPGRRGLRTQVSA